MEDDGKGEECVGGGGLYLTNSCQLIALQFQAQQYRKYFREYCMNFCFPFAFLSFPLLYNTFNYTKFFTLSSFAHHISFENTGTDSAKSLVTLGRFS